MEFSIEIAFIIFVILIVISIIITFIFNYIGKERKINLLDKEEQLKVNNFKYVKLEIIKERDPNFIRGGYGALIPIFSYIIEVYGIINKKRYLIYRTLETNEFDELNIFVNNYNKKSKCT